MIKELNDREVKAVQRKKTTLFWAIVIAGLLSVITGVILQNPFEEYQTSSTL